MKSTSLPVPAGMTRKLQGERLVLGWSWRHNGNLAAFMGVALVWNVAMGIWLFHEDWHAFSLKQGGALVFLGIGIFLAYACVAAAFNTTVVEVTPLAIRVATGPIPWHPERRIPVAGIADVIYREKAQKGYDSVYRVLVVRSDGKEMKLVSGLMDYEVTVFYVREIRAALNLPDRTLSPDA